MENYEQVLTSLRRLMRATDLHSRYLNKTSGLTSPQLLVLQALKNKQAMISREIAKEINLSQATITSILDRLEAKQLITRKRSEDDRRKVMVSLSEKGHEKIASAPAPLQESFVRQFKQLESWEQSMILSSLQRLATMMDAEDIDAAPVLDIGDIDRPAPTLAHLTDKTTL
ncbi:MULTISPECIES: MarR family winged helix-turn-helix transcriptional regulator [Corallincola]|uniref:MarR family transcriptional regulator n=3 Tax=Corallincola TaxID=1775176 RepID=A0A368N7C6_9GAMM|nr:MULTISPECIES: MarR family transcriptional regulator [Corallincola]RCU45434.1 MarR family transcriptional regulator [Corallincola holothuriorum]TAA41056.1 MarR family transcriptional regulator [Corallincola spongiicola]TCI02708.1 MarR family transcriptional regulator [Corallincola luteus]